MDPKPHTQSHKDLLLDQPLSSPSVSTPQEPATKPNQPTNQPTTVTCLPNEMENMGVGAREARATRPYDDPGGGEGKGNCEDGCNSTTVPERDLISLDCNTCFSPLLQPVHDMAIEGAGATYVCNPHPTSHPRPFSEGQGEGDWELDVLQRFQSPGLPVSSTALNAVHIHSGNAADTAALENTTVDARRSQ
ncbi:hypothetical protein CALVIDRAFT_568706 [Calocera viscosa TUFC12733]|uniref:Uncharacterized protein n=1 Tax=Calocera viscosa (strain TUFC12733) TaxID=1330018 RepID=A0A167GRC5_CALVF|nr:hypothetical protein CALVIDRAFT_568706 [Calocera viscosa TUFC12733]